ncbi:MAG: TetR/AcrR family transcriptional regulator [Verrucomicrobiota bacterium]
MEKTDSATRQKILDAALKQFAHRGYSGASVQAIVDSAHVTKPTLYYYFANKAALYKALVDSAHDERYRLMQEAAEQGAPLKEKLVEILDALFEFLNGHRELMRLAFATAFASPGELPAKMNYLKRPQRNFEFVHSLIKNDLKTGQLNRRFGSEELAYGFWGLMNVHVMAHLVLPNRRLNRKTAEGIVDLFLAGAAKK